MFSYRRRGGGKGKKKKKVVIKSKCRLYHATRLRRRRGREEVCWASPWKSLGNPRTFDGIAPVLRSRPAEFAKLFVRPTLASCHVRALGGRRCCSHFTDEEVESRGLVVGFASLRACLCRGKRLSHTLLPGDFALQIAWAGLDNFGDCLPELCV